VDTFTSSAGTASLLGHRKDTWPVSIGPGGMVTVRRFLHDLARLALRMPDGEHVMNLCKDRYAFMVGFGAAMLRRQVTLMPHTAAPDALARIRDDHPGVFCLADTQKPPITINTLLLDHWESDKTDAAPTPRFPLEQIAVTVFTSGSTGSPTSHRKSWGSLVRNAQLAERRLGVGSPYSVVATVPQQHMYGFETSIMNPLCNGGAFYTGSSFFPEDIRRALATCPAPKTLVTTPVHLRTLVKEGIALEETELVISATAPLSKELAMRAEDVLKTRVMEIFGCTEAGSIATRRTVETDVWKTFDGVKICKTDRGFEARGGHIEIPGVVADDLQLAGQDRFILLGRSGDTINIAGKRGSLGDLNIKLNQIEGVEDGVFFMPEHATDGKTTRLAAVVAAPTMNENMILAKLGKSIDPAFMPRPIIMLDSLPRNDTGKIPRADLIKLARKRMGWKNSGGDHG